MLLAATGVALLWINLDRSSYNTLWATQLSIRVGGSGIAQNLLLWVNQGLMSFFFLVIGLEARRELDLGDLRERHRLGLPFVAALSGMLLPVGIYLMVNVGHSSAHGWGAAMSTDTAFAIGMLALVGRRFPPTLRTFILTIAVFDDLVAFVVIAIAYTRTVSVLPLVVGVGALALVLGLRLRGVRNGFAYAPLALLAWVAIREAGVDPVVVGVVIGLLGLARPAARADLERTGDLFRLFREQPTAEYAHSLREGVRTALSPNERLQQVYHPLSSYVIVPLFALANAGIAIDPAFVARAYTSPITLGIISAYVIGKPVAIGGATFLVTRATRGRVRTPVGWASAFGGGAVAGIGFTVSLLIASLAFSGNALQEAKLGVLTAAVCSSAASWLILRATDHLPEQRRLRAVVGTAQPLVDLAVPVDLVRDHIRGPADAPVTLLEYGDFECTYCGRAEPVIRGLLSGFGDLRYVWRHLPLDDVHLGAQLAAEASEAAAAQGRFWEMYDLLMSSQGTLHLSDLLGYANQLGLDLEHFRHALHKRKFAGHIAEDVESADLSGVSGTPTFFINGRRHYGAYDIVSLSAEVRAARVRAAKAA